MFQKNLEAIKLKNPNLAERLEKISLDSIKNIQVFEAESKDFIITYNDTALHDTSDPAREAKSIWHRTVKSELGKNDIQIIFGLGLGYLFKRAFVNATSKIFLLEPFIDILRFVFEYVDFSQELAEERVYITDNLEELLSKMQSDYLAGDRVEFLFLNPYALLKQEQLLDLTEKVIEMCKSRGVDQNTIFAQSKHWVRNSILNLGFYEKSRTIKELEGAFKDKPALIVSAGPSLIDNIEKIKTNKDKFIIIAVAPAFKILVKEGIIPDFVTFADPNHLEMHTQGVESYLDKINIVAGSRADSYIYKQKTKSKLIYFSETDSFAKWVKENSDYDTGLYKSGGTVSIMSYYFAKNLGCNPIIFVGLDLAFIDNVIYADNKKLKVDENGIIDYGFALDTPKKLTYVKGYNGEMIPSRDDYAAFIRQFNEIFTQEENSARIINTSLSGAMVNGMEYVEFAELLSQFSPLNKNIDSIISDKFSQSKEQWNNACKKLLNNVEIQQKEIQKVLSLSEDMDIELEQICELFTMREYDLNVIQAKIEAIKDTLIEIRKRIIENVLLSTAMQEEVWEYTKVYKTSILPGIEEVKSNMNVEKEFFKKVIQNSKEILDRIETVIEKQSIKSV